MCCCSRRPEPSVRLPPRARLGGACGLCARPAAPRCGSQRAGPEDTCPASRLLARPSYPETRTAWPAQADHAWAGHWDTVPRPFYPILGGGAVFAKGAPLPFSTEPRATDPQARTRCGGSAARRPPHDGADVHPDTEAETSPGQQHGHHVTRAQDSRRADNPRRLCFLRPHGQRGLRKGRREEATPDPKSGGAGGPACLGPSHPTLSAERSQAKAQLSRPWGRALCRIGRAVRWLAAPTAHLRPAPTLGDHPAGRAGARRQRAHRP